MSYKKYTHQFYDQLIKTILTLLFIFVLASIMFGQNIGRWYHMTPYQSQENSRCIYNSKSISAEDSLDLNLKSIPEGLSDIHVSYFNLSGHTEKLDRDIKAKVYGIRAFQNNNPVLIIDSQLDQDFSNDKILELPELKLEEGVPYNEIYVFPTRFNQDYKMTYDYYDEQDIHQKTSHLGFSVYSKYDTLNKRLYYLDKFKLCFNQRLQTKFELDNKIVNISNYDYLPWISAVEFLVSVDSINKTVNIKDHFYTTTENKYQIDSIDFVNNKLLIKESKSIQILDLQSESLFSEETVSMSHTTSQYRIVHVWGSWCRPCMKNMPKLMDINNSHKDIQLIGICLDNDKSKAARAAEKNGINWTNLYFDYNNEEVKEQLNIQSYPTYFVVNSKNEIVDKFTHIEQLNTSLNQLIK